MVKRRARKGSRPKNPKLDDLWYARRGRKGKFVLSGAMNQVIAHSLWRAEGGVCGYCSRPTYVPSVKAKPPRGATKCNIDHRDPVALGGTWKRYNLISACETCNRAKGDLDEATYRAILARFPPEPSGRFVAQVRSVAREEMGRRARARNATRQTETNLSAA